MTRLGVTFGNEETADTAPVPYLLDFFHEQLQMEMNSRITSTNIVTPEQDIYSLGRVVRLFHFRSQGAVNRMKRTLLRYLTYLCCSRDVTFSIVVFAAMNLLASEAMSQSKANGDAIAPRKIAADLLTEERAKEVEVSIDKGLAFLARQQRPDGSFQQIAIGEPGISGLCLMAFMSRGHLPGQGLYAEQLNKTVNFILNSQQSDGLISRERDQFCAQYNHGISALALSELYGMSEPADEDKLRKVIDHAIVFTGQHFPQPKSHSDDAGSWRYLTPRGSSGGDLSVTSWNVMFLRSAKNSGFEVDPKLVEEAIRYMRRLYDPGRKTFRYEIHTTDPDYNHTRGMAGAGVLSMSLAGEHHSEQAETAARYILKRPFDQYTRPIPGEQYASYAAFYCSHGLFQMGGEFWDEFYPQLVNTLLKSQRANGSWAMMEGKEAQIGPEYVTCLTILALTPPYQMLPIFQR